MNVGLIGCGRVAKKHAIAIKESGCEIIASCDIIPERAQEYCIAWTTDYKTIVANDAVDIVSICTPSDLHAEMAIAAAANGKHVLVEKPLALSISDAERVMKVCSQNGVKLCVVVQNRFNKPIQKLRSMLLGDVLVANATCRWNRPQEYYSDWQSSWERSGGIIINQLIHPLDMLLYLVGDVASVTAYADNQCRQLPFPDTYVANLRFWNGAIGSFEGTVCAYPRNAENSITLVYEKGVVKVGGIALDNLSYMLTDIKITSRKHSFEKTDIYGNSHVEQYKEMVLAIKENRRPITDGYSAVKALKLAYAIHDSARENKEIYLE